MDRHLIIQLLNLTLVQLIIKLIEMGLKRDLLLKSEDHKEVIFIKITQI